MLQKGRRGQDDIGHLRGLGHELLVDADEQILAREALPDEAEVGRGGQAATCVLIPDNADADARARLETLEHVNDGFRLAELDWQQRGPGDLAGVRQSGGSLMQLAEFMTPELVALAQREARTIHAEDPDLSLPEHELLARRVSAVRDARSDLS